MEPIADYIGGRLRVESLSESALAGRLAVPADLQGPPEIAHGGAVAALLLEIAERHARDAGGLRGLPRPLRVAVTLVRALPLETPLAAAAVRRDEGAYRSRITREDGTLLAEAAIHPIAEPPAPGGRAHPTSPHARAISTNRDEVPGTTMCLACGARNPRGLAMRLEHDDTHVWKRLTPPPEWCERDGSAGPALALVVLDEIGWWLGAIACRECGLSARVEVTLGKAVAADAPLLVIGARADTASDDPRKRLWRTHAALLADSGECVAVADVSFAGGPAFTKAMAADLFDSRDREAARRFFPGAVLP